MASCQEKEQPSAQRSTADFTYSGTLQNTTPLQFASQAPGATSFSWTFGDGTGSADPNPAHTFRRAGSYAVQLRVDGPLGPAAVTKTLVLAQADTLTPILAKVAGRYVFHKVVEKDYSGAPPGWTYRRLPDTTMTITTNPRGEISMHHYTMPLQRQYVPWTNLGSPPCYFFYSGSATIYGLARFQTQSDSLIFEWRRGGLSGGTTRTYYGRKI